MTHWVRWHDAYDDADGSLSRRLLVVGRFLSRALDERQRPSGVVTVLSLCAGDGRDVVPLLAAGGRPAWVRAALVELDPVLAARARAHASAAGAVVEVREADAGRLSSFADVVPVDVLMLCGVFGNLEPDSVRALVATLPSLVVPGGLIVWTRGGSEPDQRPVVRRSFLEAGAEEVAYEGAPEAFGVGLNRVPATARPGNTEGPEHLFEFVVGR